MDVVVAALEFRMLAHGDEDVQIAGGTAVESSLALARDAQARAVVDAGRDLHRNLLFFARAARAVARRARRRDHFAHAAELVTRARHGKDSLRVADLSAPGAAAARRRLRPGLRARAAARL